MSDTFKTFGCILIIVGIAIGGGMLALPLVTAAIGFPLAILLLIFCWAVMSLTALLILEVNLAFPAGTNFSAMSRHTLGRVGQITTWVSLLLLYYTANAAYISGGSSMLSVVTKLIIGITWPNWINVLIFIIVLGGVVVLGIRSVDYINRSLMTIKGIVFFVMVFLILPDVNATNLVSSTQQLPYIWHTLPILMLAFCSHIVIPSIRSYIGPDVKRLRIIVLSGSFIPLMIYICWELVTLGVLPLHGANSFQNIAAKHGSIEDMVMNIQHIAGSKCINLCVDIFTNIALTTSFLGLSISALDFLSEETKISNRKFSNRFIVSLLTFIPSSLFVFLYPKGFVLALGYSSIFVAILALILPPLMVRNLRKKNKEQIYRTWQTTPILWLLVLLGIGFAVVQILSSFHILPGSH